MNNLSEEVKKELLDKFGQKVIECSRDRSLSIPKRIIDQTLQNQRVLAEYEGLNGLNEDERKLVKTLISETITDTIFNLLHMFEDYPDNMRLYVVEDGIEYDIRDICEVVGAEIAFEDEEGWIQKFSKIDINTKK